MFLLVAEEERGSRVGRRSWGPPPDTSLGRTQGDASMQEDLFQNVSFADAHRPRSAFCNAAEPGLRSGVSGSHRHQPPRFFRAKSLKAKAAGPQRGAYVRRSGDTKNCTSRKPRRRLRKETV